MKKLILTLLFLTNIVSAKYLYMGHFTGCSFANRSQATNINPSEMKDIKQWVVHNFQLTTHTQWLFSTNNDFCTIHLYLDHNYQVAVFVDIILSGKDEWVGFEKELTYVFTPANISREIIELK